MIVWNAHLINSGQMPVLRTRDTDFFFERKVLQSEAALRALRIPAQDQPRMAADRAGQQRGLVVSALAQT